MNGTGLSCCVMSDFGINGVLYSCFVMIIIVR
jgi:hypothetical protein